MKTRLLKKVRKRYSIIRIDEIASNASDVHRYLASEYGLPFYEVREPESVLCQNDRGFKTYIEAFDYLKKLILKQYSEQFRHKSGKETKVWWTK